MDTGSQSVRQIINANAELLKIFGGHDKIQFHQIMERLGDHLFEIEPYQIHLKVGGKQFW